MICTTNSGTTCLHVKLDYHGLLHALSLLQCNPIWKTLLSKTDIFKKFSDKNPPAGNRLADFINKVSIPLGIPFHILWVWLCTDFSLSQDDDPFLSANKYLKEKLNPEDYLQVTQNEEPINLRKGLRIKRSVLKLSLAEMASLVGVNRDKISVLERKDNDASLPRCDTLNQVLPFYGLHPVELYALALKDEDSMPNCS